MIEIVNGFICMNCCDVDKARLGQDPHQSTDQIQKGLDRERDKLAPRDFGPAVTFGGSLQASATNSTSNLALRIATEPIVLSRINVIV